MSKFKTELDKYIFFTNRVIRKTINEFFSIFFTVIMLNCALARFYVMLDKPCQRFGKPKQLAENLF